MFFKLKSYCKETTKHMMNEKTAIGKIFEQLWYYFIITFKIFCQHKASSNDSKILTADLLYSL